MKEPYFVVFFFNNYFIFKEIYTRGEI